MVFFQQVFLNGLPVTKGSEVGSWGGEPEGLGANPQCFVDHHGASGLLGSFMGIPKAAQEAIETLHMTRLGFLVSRMVSSEALWPPWWTWRHLGLPCYSFGKTRLD